MTLYRKALMIFLENCSCNYPVFSVHGEHKTEGDLQNKELVGDIWSPTSSMRNLKYFLSDAIKHKARVHQLDFIGAFLQAKIKNRVFVKLENRYVD